MQNKLFVLLVNYNSSDDCIQSIGQIISIYNPNIYIVLVDNCSTDNSVNIITEWLKKNVESYIIIDDKSLFQSNNTITCRFTFILSSTNNGFAAGNNLFLKKFDLYDSWIWMLNPDSIPTKDTISYLNNNIDKFSKNDIIGGVIIDYYDHNNVIAYGGASINFYTATIIFCKKKDRFNKIDYIHGGCLIFHSNTLDSIGYMREDLFLYWEETDWCLRAKAQNVTLRLDENIIIYDKVGGSIGRGYLAEYYYSRNGLNIINKYKKKLLFIALLFQFLRALLKLIKLKPSSSLGILNGVKDFLYNNEIKN
ncbi:MAG: glycosyltransferase family 2 protein [Cytophagales bacterium]|nr:glycosyltransferase family 2 protein [Cytophagales bacterium]